MVSLDQVHKNNASLKDYGPNLVAVFVGGTSGIGEATARAFVRDTLSPRVFLVGRNESQASRIIEELRQLNPKGQLNFIKCDAARLNSVDEACKDIQAKEDKINLLFLSAGMLTTKGRDETDEGLDKKLSLHYYSRMRFIKNLLPQLTKAGTVSEESAPAKTGVGSNLARVVSVLEAGGEGPLNLDDLSLKSTYSLRNAAKHAITMTSLSVQELAASHPEVCFVHAYPGVVNTGLMPKPWVVPLNESGDRHLYASTSSRFPPRASAGGDDVAPGADGVKGSGAYLLSWDGSTAGNQKVLQDYRKNETGKLVWEHTVGVFESICGKAGVSQD
ncbi:hypothetical protein N7526_007425 [Penicillium atrosanguineum]|nr:hypothetical protein N7526_007425 [Penicillium atrosanguineum]